jgi:LPPG:FO 2-phospho-L-lactate transferase
MKIAVLAGGVGGARFVQALAEVVEPREVTVIANVGDDLQVHGLHVSPDLDTLLYTLGGLGDEERGWGRAGETWNAREAIETLGGDTWFQLGDRDLGLHLVRTEALRRGEPLSAVTERIARAVGLELTLLPATDDRLRTLIRTPAGELEFQEWFVARGHRDRVDEVVYEGAATALAAPGVLAALDDAELIAIAPSNPFVSIGPILAVAEIRAAVERRRERVVAVSPLIGGRAVKGPAAAMFESLAGGTSAAQVTDCYKGLVGALVLDEADADDADEVAERGVRPLVTRTLMSDRDARQALIETVLGLVPTS